jgi:hypothetical protein
MATQTATQLPVRTRVTVTYQGRETQGQITAKSTDWAADVLLLGLAATITIKLPWSEVAKNEYRCFTVETTEDVTTIAEIEPRNDHPMNWSGLYSRENAWVVAGIYGLPTVFVGRDGSTKDLGVVFNPAAYERAAYGGYVGYGLSMTDGHYAPIDFDAWVKSFRKFPEFGQNDASKAVKAALPKYIAALAQAGIR